MYEGMYIYLYMYVCVYRCTARQVTLSAHSERAEVLLGYYEPRVGTT